MKISEWKKELQKSSDIQFSENPRGRTMYGMKYIDPSVMHMIVKVPRGKIVEPLKLKDVFNGLKTVQGPLESVPELLKLPYVVVTQLGNADMAYEIVSEIQGGFISIDSDMGRMKHRSNGTLWIFTDGDVSDKMEKLCTVVKIGKKDTADIWYVEPEEPVEEKDTKEVPDVHP